KERRASRHTLSAYAADLTDLFGFLSQYNGAEPDLTTLSALRPADLRAFLAFRDSQGVGTATRARQLSSIRSFMRFLAKRHGVSPNALAGLRGPRLKTPAPRALRESEARDVIAETG